MHYNGNRLLGRTMPFVTLIEDVIKKRFAFEKLFILRSAVSDCKSWGEVPYEKDRGVLRTFEGLKSGFRTSSRIGWMITFRLKRSKEGALACGTVPFGVLNIKKKT